MSDESRVGWGRRTIEEGCVSDCDIGQTVLSAAVCVGESACNVAILLA
jgi:hypothetical protein